MQPSDPSIPPVPAVAAPPAAPPPTPGDIDDVLDEQGGLLAALRGRLISLRTMSRPLRVATIVALVQLGLVGLLLATHDLPQPQVAAGIASNFSSARLPLITFVAVTLSLGLGWCFLLIGALRVHWRLRLAVVALVTVALGFYPVVQLRSDAGLTGQPFATERVLAWMQLGVLAVCWIWAISLALVGRSPSRRLKAAPEGPPATRSAAADPGRSDTVAARGSRPAASPGFPARTFWLVCALMAIYEGAALGVWLAYRQAGITLGVGVFAQSLTGQVFLLPLLLAAVIYWSSSDLIEWGELGGRALLRVVRRSDPVGRAGIPRLLIGLASVTALGVALDVLRVYGGSVVLPTLLAVALAGLLALLAVFARVDATWPTQVPATAVLAGVAFLFAEFVLEYQIGYALASWRGLPVDAAGPAVGVMVGMFVAVVAMTAGVLLVARGRLLRRGELGATGLFLVVTTLLVLLGQWSLILGTLGLPAPHHPLHLLAGVRLVAALGTLGLVGWALVSWALERPPAQWGDMRRPLAAALLLLIGLQLIEWWFDVVAAQTALGALSPLAFSAIFLVAVFWDVLTSGDGITNGDSRAFPRDGRMLLYLGYTVVASSVLLYAATVHIAASGALSAETLSTGNDAALGLLVLGFPLVLLGFVLRFGPWLATRRPAVRAGAVPARTSMLAGAQTAILGIGLVALLAVVALTTWRVVPLAVAGARPGLPARGTPASTATPGSAVYQAHVPGPGCDARGAQWTLVPADAAAQCEPAGLQVMVDASSSVLLGFVPPGGAIPADYEVSARVDLSEFASGCAGIITRALRQGFYEADLCADGEWGIFRKTGSAQQIGQGTTSPATFASIAVAVQGAHLTFSVDGTALDTIADATLTASDFIDLSLNNLGNAAGSAVVSDFVYQPRGQGAVAADGDLGVMAAENCAAHIYYAATVGAA